MLGTTPFVSISDRRLGGIANSSLRCLAAIFALAVSTSRMVRPSPSRTSRRLCPADSMLPPSVLPGRNLIPCRSELHHPVMFGICNTGTLLCGSAKDKKNARCLRLRYPQNLLNERLLGTNLGSRLSCADLRQTSIPPWRSRQEGEFLTLKDTKSRLKAERCYESRTCCWL